MYVKKNEKNANKCSTTYPNVNVVENFETLLNDQNLDAIVIATPVDSHYPLSKLALKAGKHVLVEKPLTSSYKEAKELVDIALEKNKILMVDHTFLYTGAVMKLKELVNDKNLGDIQYVDSTRINLGLFQHDVNVLWDLAPHDISISNYLLGKNLYLFRATGVSHTKNEIENIAYLTLKYENNIIAHFNCSWVSPVKIRQMLIGGTEKMVVFNDMEPTEKIKIYDTGYQYENDDERNDILLITELEILMFPKLK